MQYLIYSSPFSVWYKDGVHSADTSKEWHKQTQTYTPFKTSSMTLTMIKTIKTNLALLNLSLMILETLNPKFKQFSPKYQLFYPIQKKILNFCFLGQKIYFQREKKDFQENIHPAVYLYEESPLWTVNGILSPLTMTSSSQEVKGR